MELPEILAFFFFLKKLPLTSNAKLDASMEEILTLI